MAPWASLGSIGIPREINESAEAWQDCERCSLQFRLEADEVSHLEFVHLKAQHNTEWIRHITGAFLGLAAGMFLTLGYLVSSYVNSMGAMQSSGIRSLFAAVILLPLIAIFKPKFEVEVGTHLELVALSVVFGAKFIAFTVGSNSLPIAEFSLLANTVPIYTTALGCIFLRERCLKKVLACVVATTGVVIVCLPGSLSDSAVVSVQLSQRATGYASTLFSALANAIALIWLRSLGSLSAMWVSLYASVSTFLLSAIGAGIIDKLVVPNSRDLALVALAGVCTLMQSYLPAVACVLTDPSRVAISMTMAVVFSFILQATVQQAAPMTSTYIGAVLVIAAMIISSVKWNRNRESEDEKALLDVSKHLPSSWGQYGAVALIGSPESGRLCSACRLAT